jgi:hypothetical protein
LFWQCILNKKVSATVALFKKKAFYRKTNTLLRMKNLVYLLCMGVICFITSCERTDVDPDSNLIGNWKAVSHYMSSGGPGEWHDLPADSKRYLEFKTDGTLNGNDLASEYATYVVKDSVTLTLTKKNSDVIQNYRYKIEGRYLYLSPAGPIYCIEGCSTKYFKR